MGGWIRRRSMKMSRPLMGGNGLEESTLSAADSHARTSRTRGGGKGSRKATGAGSGSSSSGSFARWDRDTSSWRTSTPSLIEDSTSFSGRWPNFGMMRAGECSAQPTWERPTCESASSCWPTPVARDDNKTPEAHLAMKRRMGERDGSGANRTAITSLQVLVQMWPTPNVPNGGRTLTAEDVANKGMTDKGKRQVGLENAARYWPTPRTSDTNGAGLHGDGGMDLRTASSMWESPTSNQWKGGTLTGETEGRLPTQAERDFWRTPCVRDNHPCGRENRTKHIATYQLAHQVEEFSRQDPPTETPGSECLPDVPSLPRRLNVLFVEWLQGFPIGWTGLNPLEMP
jgi:hypothetical protein